MFLATDSQIWTDLSVIIRESVAKNGCRNNRNPDTSAYQPIFTAKHYLINRYLF